MRIVLGSGKIYMVEFSGSIPADNVIETDGNRFGAVKGGASIEYKPTFYTAKDDLGTVAKNRLTEEEATLKCGVMTLDGQAFKKVCSTARVTTDGSKRVVKIGGAGNDDGKKYLIRFVHEDEEDGDIRLTIVGRNEAGFTMQFKQDEETVIDLEFTAHPHDTDGTLILYEEELVSDTTTLGAVALSLTAPVKSATPQSSISAGTGYTGTIAWSPAAATFAGGTVYTSTIVLTAASGYEFAAGFNATNVIGLPATTGTTPPASAVSVAASRSTVTITITWAATAA